MLLLLVCTAACTSINPEVEAGMLEGQVFTPLASGDVLRVQEGLQTGKWVMPSVRTKGVDVVGDLTAVINLADGREVGRMTISVVLEGDESHALLDYVPVPISHDPNAPTLEEVYGSAATLSLHFEDSEGVVAESELVIQLEDGDI